MRLLPCEAFHPSTTVNTIALMMRLRLLGYYLRVLGIMFDRCVHSQCAMVSSSDSVLVGSGHISRWKPNRDQKYNLNSI